MTPEQEQELQSHVQKIAAILYQDTPSEQLTSLEGIEVAVRQHVLERISPEIGIFLSAQVAAQRQAEVDKSTAVSVNSASRKGKLRNSK
jgi:predicted flap endonuclease-1-like 5' DNA nuclease